MHWFSPRIWKYFPMSMFKNKVHFQRERVKMQNGKCTKVDCFPRKWCIFGFRMWLHKALHFLKKMQIATVVWRFDLKCPAKAYNCVDLIHLWIAKLPKGLWWKQRRFYYQNIGFFLNVKGYHLSYSLHNIWTHWQGCWYVLVDRHIDPDLVISLPLIAW